MKKTDLELILKQVFAAEKWQLERIAHLPAAFVHPLSVTPFFQPRILRMTEHHYMIDGFIGALHREFEAEWIKFDRGARKINTHCLALNIANVDRLRAEQHIYTDHAEASTYRFSMAVMDVLGKLPHDERTFCLALQNRIVTDISIDRFVILGRSEKFCHLKSFLIDKCQRVNRA